jgi:hypothetical protein
MTSNDARDFVAGEVERAWKILNLIQVFNKITACLPSILITEYL